MMPPGNPTDKIAALWQRSLPILRARVDLLTRAAEAARDHTLNDPLRAEANAVAHKLAGSLGMFGHHKAGELASQLEHLYESPTQPDPTALTTELHQLLFPE